MHLKYPWLLTIIIFFAIGLFFYWVFLRRNKKRTYLFPNVEIVRELINKRRLKIRKIFNIVKNVLFVLIFVLLAILASRPQKEIATSNNKHGLDIVFVMDGSGSMGVTDISPSRLVAVRETIKSFVDRLENDRVALIAFSKTPITLCPLTFDYNIIDYYMDMMEIEKVSWFIKSGETAIGDALLLGTQKFDDFPNRTKIIIVLTDGQSNTGIEPSKAAAYAKKNDIKIYSIFVSQQNDTKALETMQDIAQTTGGKSYDVKSRDMLEDVFEEIESLERTNLKYQENVVYQDNPNVLIIFTFIFLTAYLILKIIKKFNLWGL